VIGDWRIIIGKSGWSGGLLPWTVLKPVEVGSRPPPKKTDHTDAFSGKYVSALTVFPKYEIIIESTAKTFPPLMGGNTKGGDSSIHGNPPPLNPLPPGEGRLFAVNSTVLF